MISRKEINQFFSTYRNNLKESFQWNDKIFSSTSKEIWLTNMINRSHSMQKIYIENETLIQEILQPILENPCVLG